jgi:hypothetical protein
MSTISFPVRVGPRFSTAAKSLQAADPSQPFNLGGLPDHLIQQIGATAAALEETDMRNYIRVEYPQLNQDNVHLKLKAAVQRATLNSTKLKEDLRAIRFMVERMGADPLRGAWDLAITKMRAPVVELFLELLPGIVNRVFSPAYGNVNETPLGRLIFTISNMDMFNQRYDAVSAQEIFDKLIAAGANKNGGDAVWYAAYNKNTKYLEQLFTLGANLNVSLAGETCLFAVIGRAWSAPVTFLLDRGADPNAPEMVHTPDGQTILMTPLACCQHYLEIERDPDSRDHLGPPSQTIIAQFEEVERSLKAHGAR